MTDIKKYISSNSIYNEAWGEDDDSEPRHYGQVGAVTQPPPKAVEVGSITKFKEWYGNAKRGESYTYHVGNLAYDRVDWDHGGVPIEPLDSLAREVAKLSKWGLVAMVQVKSELVIGAKVYTARKVK